MIDKTNKESYAIDRIQNNLIEIKREQDDIVIQGQLEINRIELDRVFFILENQSESLIYLRPCSLELEATEGTYSYTCSLNIPQISQELSLLNQEQESFYCYLRVEAQSLNQALVVSLNMPSFASLKQTDFVFEDTIGLTTTTYALKVSQTSQIILQALSYHSQDYEFFKERANFPNLSHYFSKHKDAVLIGGANPFERSFNAWDFFLYLRQNHPDIPAYFVLDKTCPDYEDAKFLGQDHLLDFKSREYFQFLLACKTLVTSGPSSEFYPSQSPGFNQYIKAEKIILPAHIFGLEDLHWNYSLEDNYYDIKRIIASSRQEARFLNHRYQVDLKAVDITGLPQHSLIQAFSLAPDKKEKQVLFLPSQKKAQIKNFQDLDRVIKNIIEQADIRAFLRKNRFVLKILVPEGALESYQAYENKRLKFASDTPDHVLQEMAKSKLAIINDRPEALDLSLLETPMIFYLPFEDSFEDQFYTRYQNELPGEIINHFEDLPRVMELIQENDFRMAREHKKKADFLFEIIDENSNQRIYEQLKSFL